MKNYAHGWQGNTTDTIGQADSASTSRLLLSEGLPRHPWA